MLSMLGILYSFVAVVALIGYMPQIRRIWVTKSDCRDISLSTWFIWTLATFISLAYGIFELGDWKFCMITGVNATCHAAILGMIIYKRYTFAPAIQPATAQTCKNPV